MFQRIVRIKNDVAEIPRVSREAAELLESQRLDAHFLRTVSLGLEEVVTNIIKYGYDDDREHWVEITLRLTTVELQITVMDDGCEFNPLEHPEPDRTKPLHDREPGGLGVSFFRQLFDEVQYRREAGRNFLSLRKHLPDVTPQ